MANDEARDLWDSKAAAWDKRATSLEAFVDEYGLPPMVKLDLAPGDRVLEIGCGPGVTTLKIAELVGPEAEVVAVDIAPGMIDAARARADKAGAANVTFVVADAQSDPLGTGFDAVYSRFGVMFFSDPAKAFSNIGTALHPGGRFGAAVWGPVESNPWMFLPTMAAAQTLGITPQLPEPGAPGPFSLADPALVEKLLTGGGFNTIANETVEGKRIMRADTAEEDARMLLEVGPMADAFVAADATAQSAVVAAVIDSIAEFKTDTGWSVPGLARCVTAVRG